jgi:hypothetical protein
MRSVAAPGVDIGADCEHHVDAIIAGHDHYYERGHAGDLPYFVTGGGGPRSSRPGISMRP